MSPGQSGFVSLAAVDKLCDRFEEALRAGDRPEIESWLSASGADAGKLLPELAALELRYRFQRGEAATAADYLARFPELRADRKAAIELVAVEFRARQAHDPKISEAELRQHYPDLAILPEWSMILSPVQPGQVETTAPPETTGDAVDARPNLEAFLKNFLDPPARPDDLGRLERYDIKQLLGAGGMGLVLEGRDSALQRDVAIKLMRPEVAGQPNARVRFLREARAAAAVEHPRVVAIHHVDEWRGTPFLVMPHMRGRSLADRLRDPAPLPVEQVVLFAREAAEGLAAAHARSLIHRDIKPGNIWLEESAHGWHVRLLDFGLARVESNEELTRSAAVAGTPHYMAPEQAAGEQVDARADLFSLGCVLYEMLTRTKPFDGSSVIAVLSALANHYPVSPLSISPGIPGGLSDLTMRLLEKSRDKRPRSAHDVVNELEHVEGRLTTACASTMIAAQAPKDVQRRPAWRRGWVAAATAALLVVAALVAWPRNHDTRTSTPDPSQADQRRGHGSAHPGNSQKPPEPLKVLSLEVRHYAREAGGDVERGVVGSKSFAAALGDKVQVAVRLSSPAYAYLVAFRPDGVADVCFPESEEIPPPLTDEPSYPAAGSKTAYGLNEGAGLWAFAVIASESPLPAWRDWLREHGAAAFTWQSVPRTPPDQVWRDDGTGRIRTYTPRTVLQIDRGKGDQLEGPAATLEGLTDSLLAAQPGAVVATVGFGVLERGAAPGK